jgi:hypothetical protein
MPMTTFLIKVVDTLIEGFLLWASAIIGYPQ